MKKKLPDFLYETPYWAQNYLIIGVDEVGRGALAGPVGVGAVCFDPTKTKKLLKMGINDSKKLSQQKREQLCKEMKSSILASSVMFSPVSLINSKGIVFAVNNAIRRAVFNIQEELSSPLPFHLLLDAFQVKHISGIGLENQTAIIKGDEKSISIAGASILAKVERDQTMTELSKEYPEYRWAENKGYGTKTHCKAIEKLGPTKLHRTLFVRNYCR